VTDSPPRVVVIGAGAFGGWSALELARRGARVTLLDAWGPGNARASSGGETRVIRAAYGTRAHYTAMAARALHRWRAFERDSGQRLLRRTGVLWTFDSTRPFGRASEVVLARAGIPVETFSPSEAARRYPQIDFTGVDNVLLEPDAGYLLARRACEEVAVRVEALGGACRLAAVRSPVDVSHGRLATIPLHDGTTIDGDAWVFACGAWLGQLFPDVIGRRIVATRQEVHYFGPPAGDQRFTEAELPAWIDVGATMQVYGIPGNAYRGFKIAADAAGPFLDPTSADREATPEAIAGARAFLARRFPALARAPLVGSEVCQYEATPDAELIVDRDPRASNVWIVGGGSGHGFKLGPAVGEMVASHLLDGQAPDPRFALARFAHPPPGGWQDKWE